MMIFAGSCTLLGFLFLPETFAPVLLTRKAKLLRKANPEKNISAGDGGTTGNDGRRARGTMGKEGRRAFTREKWGGRVRLCGGGEACEGILKVGVNGSYR